MSKRKYAFDPECFKLAEHFLAPNANSERKSELAQCIQDAVEEFCEMERDGLKPIAWGGTH